jgi:YfiH family protein
MALVRRTTPDGVVYYASPLLEAAGLPHAFSTRIGGVSPPPFDSMNLGNPSGCATQDQDARIDENYRRLQRAVGCESRRRCWAHQVHGGDVLTVNADEPFENGQRADALVSDDPERVMAVRVADCVPILFATSDGRRVAAVHAGWRGVIAGVAPHALQELIGERGSLEGVIAAIGPCIGFDAFEVGPEVIAEFVARFGPAAPVQTRNDGKGHVDLREAVRRQLVNAAVLPGRIDTTDRCTFRDQEEFFSHRRDNGVTGRMAALIGVKSTAEGRNIKTNFQC